MNNFLKVFLILLALLAFYGFLVRNKSNQGKGKSQDQLLDSMSHEELVNLLVNLLPGKPNMPEIQKMTNEQLKEQIIRYQKEIQNA